MRITDRAGQATSTADGLRRRTTVGTNVTDYVLDGQSAVRTLLNSSVDKTYLHGPRGPEYERTAARRMRERLP